MKSFADRRKRKINGPKSGRESTMCGNLKDGQCVKSAESKGEKDRLGHAGPWRPVNRFWSLF